MLVVLRDGRKMIGVLRSYDQYGALSCPYASLRAPRLSRYTLSSSGVPAEPHAANFVLQDAVERIHHGRLFAEVPRGLFLVRGENVVLLGEIVRLRPCTRYCAHALVSAQGLCASPRS